MTRDLTLRPANRDDRAYIEDLLERNDLPTADVREQLHCLCLCERDDSPIGVGGLERHGDVGLLRSLAIEDSARGRRRPGSHGEWGDSRVEPPPLERFQ